jgi:hypothetical protein
VDKPIPPRFVPSINLGVSCVDFLIGRRGGDEVEGVKPAVCPVNTGEIESGQLKVKGIHPFGGYFVIFPVATGLFSYAIVIFWGC